MSLQEFFRYVKKGGYSNARCKSRRCKIMRSQKCLISKKQKAQAPMQYASQGFARLWVNKNVKYVKQKARDPISYARFKSSICKIIS